MADGRSGMSGWKVVLPAVGLILGILVWGAGACGLFGQCKCAPPGEFVAIQLSCLPAEAPVVKTTGPCSVCPAVPPNTPIPGCAAPENSQYVLVTPSGAGTCHVELTFGRGGTSSVDLDFMSEWIACGSDPHGCGEGFSAASVDGNFNFQVSVPESSCDAGADVEASG